MCSPSASPMAVAPRPGRGGSVVACASRRTESVRSTSSLMFTRRSRSSRASLRRGGSEERKGDVSVGESSVRAKPPQRSVPLAVDLLYQPARRGARPRLLLDLPRARDAHVDPPSSARAGGAAAAPSLDETRASASHDAYSVSTSVGRRPRAAELRHVLVVRRAVLRVHAWRSRRRVVSPTKTRAVRCDQSVPARPRGTAVVLPLAGVDVRIVPGERALADARPILNSPWRAVADGDGHQLKPTARRRLGPRFAARRFAAVCGRASAVVRALRAASKAGLAHRDLPAIRGRTYEHWRTSTRLDLDSAAYPAYDTCDTWAEQPALPAVPLPSHRRPGGGRALERRTPRARARDARRRPVDSRATPLDG